MTQEQYDKLIKTCDEIAADAQKDARNFDGLPLTGMVVATYFGYHGAAISTLAELIKEVIRDSQSTNRLIQDSQNNERIL